MATVSIPVPHIVTDVLSMILPQAYIDWWINLLHENPTHLYIETTLILFIIYILFKSPKDSSKRRHEVTEEVLMERLACFKPEPLAPEVLSEEATLVLNNLVVLDSAPSASRVKVKGKSVLNFASADFLDFGSSPEVRKATEDALNKYGVGSCGPRGFYGTIDAHIKLEEALAEFFHKAEAIIYSDGSSTVCSAIPAFANRSDLLVVDDGCNDNVFTGVRLSRARVIRFKHNDVADLERVLKQVEQEDSRLGRKPSSYRRFILFEGLYRNSGDIAPLPDLYRLKMQHKWRLIADECLSFGVLGKTGKGVTEHFEDVVPDDAVEILLGSLETTLASVGGFCVGSQEVVEHQRLNGAGYCFSASAPPFTATAAQAALELLSKETGVKRLKELRARCERFVKLVEVEPTPFRVISSPESPVIHLRLKKEYSSHMNEIVALRSIANSALEHDSVMVIPTYYPDASSHPANTIRLYVHANHTDEDLALACKVLKQRASKV